MKNGGKCKKCTKIGPKTENKLKNELQDVQKIQVFRILFSCPPKKNPDFLINLPPPHLATGRVVLFSHIEIACPKKDPMPTTPHKI